MKPIQFAQANTVWGEHQEEYLPLPAYTDMEYTISCWRLSWWERLVLLLRGTIWVWQRNIRAPLQAISLGLESPFVPEQNFGGQNKPPPPEGWTEEQREAVGVFIDKVVH